MRILKKKYWPAMVALDKSDDKVMTATTWCKDNLEKGQYYLVGSCSANTFYFKSEEAATMFSLKFV